MVCITVVFKSDGAVEGTGWDANVACGNLASLFIFTWKDILMELQMGQTMHINDVECLLDTGYVDVCLGDSVMLYCYAKLISHMNPGVIRLLQMGGGYDQTGDHTVRMG